MTKRVLFADDTDDMRILLRIVLLGANFTVVGEAEDGDQALQMWNDSREDGLFAVILDQRMPGMTGLDVARRILADHPDQRVVLFSAHMDDELRSEALAAGVTAVLSKDEIAELPSHPALLD